MPRFITQALADEPLTVHGDGHASRDWLYVLDDAEAIERVIEAPLEPLAGEVINVATGIDIPVSDIASMVLDALGKPRDLVRTSASGSGRSTATSAPPRRRSGCSAGRRARPSRRASSAPSRGIATMRRGGGRSSLGRSRAFSS